VPARWLPLKLACFILSWSTKTWHLLRLKPSESFPNFLLHQRPFLLRRFFVLDEMFFFWSPVFCIPPCFVVPFEGVCPLNPGQKTTNFPYSYGRAQGGNPSLLFLARLFSQPRTSLYSPQFLKLRSLAFRLCLAPSDVFSLTYRSLQNTSTKLSIFVSSFYTTRSAFLPGHSILLSFVF